MQGTSFYLTQDDCFQFHPLTYKFSNFIIFGSRIIFHCVNMFTSLLPIHRFMDIQTIYNFQLYIYICTIRCRGLWVYAKSGLDGSCGFLCFSIFFGVVKISMQRSFTCLVEFIARNFHYVLLAIVNIFTLFLFKSSLFLY